MTWEYSEDNLIEQTAIDLFFNKLGWDTLLAINKKVTEKEVPSLLFINSRNCVSIEIRLMSGMKIKLFFFNLK